MNFDFLFAHGLDTPAVTWSKTEVYNSYKYQQYITVLLKRKYCSMCFFSLERWILLGERAEMRLWLPRHSGGEVGYQFEAVCTASNSQGQTRWTERKWPPQDIAPPSPSHSSFLIPSAFRERSFPGTNVLSSFFFPH